MLEPFLKGLNPTSKQNKGMGRSTKQSKKPCKAWSNSEAPWKQPKCWTQQASERLGNRKRVWYLWTQKGASSAPGARSPMLGILTCTSQLGAKCKSAFLALWCCLEPEKMNSACCSSTTKARQKPFTSTGSTQSSRGRKFQQKRVQVREGVGHSVSKDCAGTHQSVGWRKHLYQPTNCLQGDQQRQHSAPQHLCQLTGCCGIGNKKCSVKTTNDKFISIANVFITRADSGRFVHQGNITNATSTMHHPHHLTQSSPHCQATPHQPPATNHRFCFKV